MLYVLLPPFHTKALLESSLSIDSGWKNSWASWCSYSSSVLTRDFQSGGTLGRWRRKQLLRKSFSSTPSTNFNAKIFDNHSRSSSLHLLMVYKKLCKIIFSTSTTSTSDREWLLKIFAFKFVQGVALKDFLKSCFLLQLRVRPLWKSLVKTLL